MRFGTILFLTVLLLTQILAAQPRVAVVEFKNESGHFYLDRWEKLIPELLEAQLSGRKSLRLVERRNVLPLLKEKAFSMAGLLDSSRAEAVLSAADFLVYGTVHEMGGEYQISARLVRVSDGETKSELVNSPDREHLSDMVKMLANNLAFQLTGEGSRQVRKRISGKPTHLYAAVTMASGLAAVLAGNDYRKKQDDYRSATELNLMDKKYDAANNSRKITILLASLAGTSAIMTAYSWLKNRSLGEITASQPRVSLGVWPQSGAGKNLVQLNLTLRW